MLPSHHKQINAIHQLLRQMLHQTEQLQQAQRPMHRLDRDLLIRQTQEIYEWLFATDDQQDQDILSAQQQSVTEAVQKKPEPEVLAEKEDIAPEPVKPAQEKSAELSHQIEKPKEPSIQEITPTNTPIENSEQPNTETTASTSAVEEKKPTEKLQTTQQVFSEPTKPKLTPLELFSQETPPSVGDHLQHKEDSSIGAKMERQPIQDLRAAIGINDKFLLINELFFGSLEAYNKMLDELNEFKSFNGASTYLIELKVEKQWDSKLPSWKKLVHLLERKFNVKPEDHAL